MKTTAKVILVFFGMLFASLMVCALTLFLAFFIVGRIFMFPIFMTDVERFDYPPELLMDLLPYVERWSTPLCDNSTIRTEIESVERELEYKYDLRLLSRCDTVYSVDNQPVQAILIELNCFDDWSKGVMFVASEVELAEVSGYQLRRIDQQFWVYNSVD